MQTDDSGSTDEFLEALLQEAFSHEHDDDPLRFCHAYVPASVNDTALSLQKALQQRPSFKCAIYGVDSSPRNATVYLAGTLNDTLLWARQTDLAVAGLVSFALKTTVHWISVFELFTLRAYVQIQDGNCVRELFDPERPWRTNIFVGDDLIGRGEKRFANYEAFCDAIKNDYQPKDTVYDFEKLNRDPKSLASCIEKYGRLLQIDIIERSMTLTFRGDWSAKDRVELQQKLK